MIICRKFNLGMLFIANKKIPVWVYEKCENVLNFLKSFLYLKKLPDTVSGHTGYPAFRLA